MIHNKYINKVIGVAVAFALIVALLMISFTDGKNSKAGVVQQYEKKLFGVDIISINIIANQEDWDTMIENATSEEYIMVDVVINGTKIQNVGIRPKGNSSLSQVAQDSTTNRFSFRLKFDEYIKGQTCFGLDTFVVNNMLGDNSYMKEYLSYDILNSIGVDTPLYNFTNITLNGDVWGFYLAIEAYDDSYLTRVYGDKIGKLYNVKSMDMGNIQKDVPIEKDVPVKTDVPIQADVPVQNENKGNFMGGGMGGRGSSGGDLKYTDANISSYSSIFDNAIGSVTEEDQQRVVTALEKLSTGTDLETYFDVDQILRYMAAHTVVVNLDSYSSSMAQNYYIYEKDGKITILPWDYNFSFGGFQSGSASEVVNFPIDTPVSGVTLAERPLFDKLLENEEYKAKYHEYLNEIMKKYFTDSNWEEKVAEIDTLIASYVEADPTAFCTVLEYEKAVFTLTNLGVFRAESIMGQLEGTVPSTTKAQGESPNSLILADSIEVSDLGGGMGGDRGGMDGDRGGMDGDHGDRGKIPNQSGGMPEGNTPHLKENGNLQINETQKEIQVSQDANSKKSNIIFMGGLSVILIIATVFVARFKKNY